MNEYNSDHITKMKAAYSKKIGGAVMKILTEKIADLKSQPTPKNIRDANSIADNFTISRIRVGPKHVGCEFKCSHLAWETLTLACKHNPGRTPSFNYHCGLNSQVLVDAIAYGNKGTLTIPIPVQEFSYLPADSIPRESGLNVVMGVNTAFKKVSYNFEDVGKGNVLVIAKPGSGKSVLGMNIAYDLLTTAKASQAQLMVLGGGDGPRLDWGKLQSHPLLLAPLIAGSPDELLPYLTWACVELEQRFQKPKTSYPLLMIILDEANIALRTPAVLDKLNFIGSQGRKASVKLVTLAQVRDFGEYAKHFVKNCSTVIAGNLSDNYESTRVLGVAGLDTSRLRDKGEFIMYDADNAIPQTFVPVRVMSDDLAKLNKRSIIPELVLPNDDVCYSQFYNFEDDSQAKLNNISRASALAIVAEEYGGQIGKLVKLAYGGEPMNARIAKEMFDIKDNNLAGKMSILAKRIAKEL